MLLLKHRGMIKDIVKSLCSSNNRKNTIIPTYTDLTTTITGGSIISKNENVLHVHQWLFFITCKV